MGNLVWYRYSRFVSITASIYAVWAAFLGIFFRKFFWDFVGGTLRDPGGIEPSPKAALFITVIVRFPIVQIFTMILGMIILAIELPLPVIRKLSLYRNLVIRIVLLVFQAFLTVLLYQGTNATIWSLIAAICYGRAVALGEVMEDMLQDGGEKKSISFWAGL